MNTAPLDRDADALYSRLVAEAAAAGLVVYAYGGVAVLNTPAEQRTTGDRARTLQMASLAEHPDNPRPSRADDAPAQAEESGDLFPADVPSEPSTARPGVRDGDEEQPPRVVGPARGTRVVEGGLFDQQLNGAKA